MKCNRKSQKRKLAGGKDNDLAITHESVLNEYEFGFVGLNELIAPSDESTQGHLHKLWDVGTLTDIAFEDIDDKLDIIKFIRFKDPSLNSDNYTLTADKLQIKFWN